MKNTVIYTLSAPKNQLKKVNTFFSKLFRWVPQAKADSRWRSERHRRNFHIYIVQHLHQPQKVGETDGVCPKLRGIWRTIFWGKKRRKPRDEECRNPVKKQFWNEDVVEVQPFQKFSSMFIIWLSHLPKKNNTTTTTNDHLNVNKSEQSSKPPYSECPEMSYKKKKP